MNEIDLPSILEDQSKKEESLEELLRRKEKLKKRIYYINEYLKKLYQARERFNIIRSIILESLDQLNQNTKYLQYYDKILDNLKYFSDFISNWEFIIENNIRPYIKYIKDDNDIKKDLKKYRFDYTKLEKELEEIKKKFKELYNVIGEAYNDFIRSMKLKNLEKHYIENVFNKLSIINSELENLLKKLLYTLESGVYHSFLEPLIKDKENEIKTCEAALSRIEFLISHRSIEEKKLEKEEGLQSQEKTLVQQQPREISQPPEQPAPPSQPSKQPTQLSQKIKERVKFKEKFKKIKKKGEKLPIVSIITFVSYIILLYLLFVSGNILAVLTIFIILVIIIGLISKKTLSWIAQGAILGSIIMITIYILFHTGFNRSLCVFMPYLCPQRISLSVEEQVLEIRKTIEETINRIRFIMENPELAYIESRAESIATRNAYRYIFEIEDINKLPIDYVLYSDSDQIISLSIKYLYYAIRSSLPIGGNIKMYFNAYCLIRPRFRLNCLTADSLSKLGKEVIYDNTEFFFDEENNFYKNVEVPEYGVQNIRCTIPTIYINISSCEEISYRRFYFQNNFLILVSNITTKTIYKFLVVDESVLINSFYEKRDIYDYLKLDRREYDVGYFDGFLDFPKINILRLGVLSEYPVIRFRNINNVSDIIYISFKNIEELYDVSDFEIEIKYNPDHITISLDPQFKGIQTTLYELTCIENVGKINCKVTFRKIPDDFNRNKYIIFYRDRNDKFLFFIPIVISFKENFVEYSEVIINAKATYGIEKKATTNLEYALIKI